MDAVNVGSTQDHAQPATRNGKIQILSISLLVRVGTILGLACLLVITFYSPSSDAKINKVNKKSSSLVSRGRVQPSESVVKVLRRDSGYTKVPVKPLVLPVPQASSEMVQTYASDCQTPKTVFTVGETVCVKTTGISVNSFFPRRLTWAPPNSTIVRATSITTTDQFDSLQVDATSQVGSAIVDNRGTWQVVVNNPFFYYSEARTTFTVIDPANATAEIGIASTSALSLVAAGSQATFGLQVNNYGPNSSANVQLIANVPANSSFVSFVQQSGPTFNCTVPMSGGTGTTTCVIASLGAGEAANFVATYDVQPGVPAGTQLTHTTDLSSQTDDQNTDNNSTSATATVIAASGAATCTLNCTDNITAIANTTEDNQRGAHVTYDAAEPSGTCGAITSTPASGSFFPVGTTTVTVTSETGGGSCSFTITVEDNGTNPPTITCPASVEANAGSNCAAVVTTVGTATATGDNVTIIGTRSDGKPMYTCDSNGTNCTRLTSDDPFLTGITTITWRAYSHNTPGPYADADDEESHRTGSASCTQTITVDDITPPTITPPSNQTASADENCQFTLPDYTTTATVSDNCACSSSDTGEACDNREPITITQSPAPGSLVGLGPHTITLTANDGASSNNGAGNTATAQFTVTVVDTTAPVITCPSSIANIPTEPGTCSAHVNPGTATATDNCDNPTVIGVRSDGQPLSAAYPTGLTTITWTATDLAANHSSCQQTISVVDTEPPAITCPSDLIVDFNPAVNGAVVTYAAPVGTDNCPGATTVQIAGLPSGATFPVGTTTNTFRVTDAAGNIATCSFKVTVALTAIIGLDSASLSGVGFVDSYDSSGGYPATKGSLVNVLSNGTITIAGSSKVFGNVRSTRAGVAMSGTTQVTGNATAGTTVSRTGSAIVLGTITNNALAPVMTVPAVPSCGPPYSPNTGISGTYSYNPSTGDLSLTGINVATLANGNYCFHNVTMSNSAQLRVNGPVSIRLTGTLNASGGTFSNTTAIPANLRLLSSFNGSNGVMITNSAIAQLVIYAPNTSVIISGSTPLFGTAVGKTVTISNSGVLHYDTTLKTAWPDIWTLIFGP